ncbi:MAG: PhzF family phenazine biosynthesis protein [Chloroflexi bacterium]|nr:PhzF family phenazine biosynthesis protein [Chloroflexota bacterium]
MPLRRFKQVDVFTARPFAGNPVAVILDGDGLSTEQMQAIAAWTNLSETTFVQTPTAAGADYRLRIFTQTSELPFAGHPSVGSAHAVLESGIVSSSKQQMIQECGAGLLPIRIEQHPDGRRVFVRAPQATLRLGDDRLRARVEAVLGAPLCAGSIPTLVDVGPIWLIAEMGDATAVHALAPDMAAMAQLSRDIQITGITAFGLTGRKPDSVYTRSFAPIVNVPEDPVCGSGNVSVGAFLDRFGKLGVTGATYIAHQGNEVGRDGAVAVAINPADHSVEIGGQSVTVIDGTLRDSV